MNNNNDIRKEIRLPYRVVAFIIGWIPIIIGTAYLFERFKQGPEIGVTYQQSISAIIVGLLFMFFAIRGSLFGRNDRKSIK